MPDPRMANVAEAARKLTGRGYRLSVDAGRLVFGGGELERATADVVTHIRRLGHADFLHHLFGFLRQDRYAYGQYLIARQYENGPTGSPWLPVGLLVNLAVQAPCLGVADAAGHDRNEDWAEALQLATDIATALDLQDYGPWGLINVAPRRLDRCLTRLALGDHVFALRQWPLRLAPRLLRAFFGPSGAVLDAEQGWGLEDVLPLVEALANNADQPDPQIWARRGLASKLPPGKAGAILDHLTYPPGTVNADYATPLAAADTGSSMMFKPFVGIDAGHVLVPAMSLAGPAFYEACMAAFQRSFGDDRANTLRGDGCERVVLDLFREAGMPVTITGAKYRLVKGKEGECDLVLEGGDLIVLVEAKAKSLTRATMAGVPAAALFDFARNLLASQLQALQHERVLRERGAIVFKDGRRLDLNGRRIVRLSVSLTEQASLQDRLVLWSLYKPLLAAKVEVPPGHEREEDVRKLNRALENLRAEAQQLSDLGVTIGQQTFGGSLSVAQLAVHLEGADTLEAFVARLDTRSTTMSLNPLFELHEMTRRGVLR